MNIKMIKKPKWSGINCAGALILQSGILYSFKADAWWIWTLITFFLVILALLANPGSLIRKKETDGALQ